MQASEFKPARILVRSVNWLGDAVMTTPALQRLRERFPEARITITAPEKLGELWAQHPAIDETLLVSPAEGTWPVVRRIQQQKFDLALILPNSPRSALEPWLARIPVRVGYARGWRGVLLTQAVPARAEHVPMQKRTVGEIRALLKSAPEPKLVPPAAHHVHDYLGLVAALGGKPEPLAPQLHVCEAELTQARLELAHAAHNFGVHKPLYIGLNPGAEYGPAKRWPMENFAAVARQINQKFPEAVWLVFGAKADLKNCTHVAGKLGHRALNLAGTTSLRQLMCLLKLSRVVLTNDTGPMHIAAALGTPVVVPFGSTSPELTGPGLPGDTRHHLLRSNAPCSPCFLRTCPIDLRCMTGISVDQAVHAIASVISS